MRTPTTTWRVLLKDEESLDEAAASCRRALALNPVFPQAHKLLGDFLCAEKQSVEGIACYRHALEYSTRLQRGAKQSRQRPDDVGPRQKLSPLTAAQIRLRGFLRGPQQPRQRPLAAAQGRRGHRLLAEALEIAPDYPDAAQ